MAIVRDSKGNPVRDSRGNPVTSGTPASARGTAQTPNTGNFSMAGMSNAFGGAVEKFGSDLSGAFSKVKSDFKGAFDPVMDRLKGAGISAGADANSKLMSIANSTSSVAYASGDHRVRLSLPPAAKILYNKDPASALLGPLVQVGGVVFPYTPQVIFQHNADYSRVSPTHSNYPLQFYQASNVSDISMFGEFVSETGEDAQYVLAVITFLRAITKMFSNSDDLAGNPPPILRLSGHGTYLLPAIPVVVNTVSITMPNNVDYITVPVGVGTTRVPKSLDINIGMTPVYSREQIKQFGVDKLADGRLISKITGGFV